MKSSPSFSTILGLDIGVHWSRVNSIEQVIASLITKVSLQYPFFCYSLGLKSMLRFIYTTQYFQYLKLPRYGYLELMCICLLFKCVTNVKTMFASIVWIGILCAISKWCFMIVSVDIHRGRYQALRWYARPHGDIGPIAGSLTLTLASDLKVPRWHLKLEILALLLVVSTCYI